MADPDITMSLDDTLELDAIIKDSTEVTTVISVKDGAKNTDFNLEGFQTHTGVFDPINSGTYTININGQKLTVEVTDQFNIPDSEIFYNFEDETTDKAMDTSSSSNTGTFTGTPSYISNSAYDNKALSTDSNSGVNYPDTGVVRPTNDWSVVLFIRDPNLSGSDPRYYWSGRANYDIKLFYTNGELGFSYYKGGKASTDGTAIDNDTWHMITLRNDYTNNKRKYLLILLITGQITVSASNQEINQTILVIQQAEIMVITLWILMVSSYLIQ